MDWITDQLAIGNWRDARSLTTHTLAGVSAILCLLPGCTCEDREDLQDVDVQHVPLVDAAGNNHAAIRLAVQFLSECEMDGLRVLVHCRAGRSRSAAVVARFFMESRNLTAPAAIAQISDRRETWLSPGIDEILRVPLSDRSP
jgi:protein-tyrosine phosphatase